MTAEIVAAYDAIAYPSGVFRRSHPDRLAVVARLHGRNPPPIETARVLELGGGDGLNLASVAVAFPRATFLNIDISPPAVARGQALIRAAGLTNLRNEVGDVVAAADALEGRFDYILAHGLYSWVPPEVRAAVMRLAGRVLSDEGVAFISYNTVPRGSLRLALREWMLREIAGVNGADAKIATARALLSGFAPTRDGDKPHVAALREEARRMLENEAGSLYHDELTPSYHPQALTDVVRAAAAERLDYLGEAEARMVRHGFVPDDAADRSSTAVARALEAEDFQVDRAFRNSLFVRGEAQLARRLRLDAVAELHIALAAQRVDAVTFRLASASFEVEDAAFADRLEAVCRCSPCNVPVRDHFGGEREWGFVLRLFEAGMCELSTAPSRFVAEAGERPLASSLARAIAAGGGRQNVTLDQRFLDFSHPGAGDFLQLLNGTRDRDALAAIWDTHPNRNDMSVEAGLRAVAGAALLVA